MMTIGKCCSPALNLMTSFTLPRDTMGTTTRLDTMDNVTHLLEL